MNNVKKEMDQASRKTPNMLRQAVQMAFLQGDPSHGVTRVRAINVRTDIPRHAHRNWCIGRIDEGCRVLTGQDAHFHLKAGDYYVIPPGVAHAFLPGNSSPASYSALSGNTYGSGLPLVCGFEPLRLAGHQALDTAFTAAFDAVARCDGSSVFLFLLHCVAPYFSGSGHHAPVMPVDSVEYSKQFIEDHVDAVNPLADLAHQAGLSPYYFHRLFVRATGMSPRDYLMQTRIRKACACLQQGMPLAFIAAETGFSDQSHFTREFKKRVGIPPGIYRSSCETGHPLHSYS